MTAKKFEPPFKPDEGAFFYDPDQHEQPQGEPEPKKNGKGHPPLLARYKFRPYSQIPTRAWLHAGHFIRGHVVMTVAPGGWGKSSLDLINTVEMTTGRGLIGPDPSGGKPLRVGYWNGEDPPEEIERRIAAILLFYDIDPSALEENLYLGSKVTSEQRIASLDRHQNLVINKSMLAEITAIVEAEKLDVLVFDPLIAFHRVREAYNELMEETISTTFGHIAFTYNCCVELAQHTRKSQGAADGALTVEDSRGGGSITNAARSVRVLNRMTASEARLPSISDDERRYYLRVERGKANMAPAGKATWVHLASKVIPNGPNGGDGDNVQVIERFNYPQPFDGVSADDMRWLRNQVRVEQYRSDPRAENWVGKPLAKRLKLNLDKEADHTKVSAILKKWFKENALATEKRPDAKRRMREFVVPGNYNEAVDDDAPDIPF